MQVVLVSPCINKPACIGPFDTMREASEYRELTGALDWRIRGLKDPIASILVQAKANVNQLEEGCKTQCGCAVCSVV